MFQIHLIFFYDTLIIYILNLFQKITFFQSWYIIKNSSSNISKTKPSKTFSNIFVFLDTFSVTIIHIFYQQNPFEFYQLQQGKALPSPGSHYSATHKRSRAKFNYLSFRLKWFIRLIYPQFRLPDGPGD